MTVFLRLLCWWCYVLYVCWPGRPHYACLDFSSAAAAVKEVNVGRKVGTYRHQSAYDREKSLLLYSTVKVGLSVLL